ncbi:hypothetical protein CDL15_Pgr014694 [Punica granatum]|nr:hypothetical protein CDL15_Pgr014694 [Punica granatum]
MPKAVWSNNDTLESIVRQASNHNQYHVSNVATNDVNPTCVNKGSCSVDKKPDKLVKTNSGRTRSENITAPVLKKRVRSESEQCRTTSNNLFSTSSGYRNNDQEERKVKITDHRSMCASASATFGREDRDTTMMTWPSFDSSRSFKTNQTTDDDSAASPGGSEEDQETKTETGRSLSSRQTRAAAIHNQSERRRRDRINQKMKTLQRLVPNSRKTDKASMLDEVIEYLKQLQAQVQMMSATRNINSLPQMMMMPIGVTPQQQLQMSLFSRISGGVGLGLGMGMAGIGAGMGVLDMSSMARGPAQPPGLSPLLHPTSAQFVVPTTHPMTSAQAPAATGNSGSLHFPDPYCALIAQNMNDIELYRKMAALYRQQAATNPSSKTNEGKRE